MLVCPIPAIEDQIRRWNIKKGWFYEKHQFTEEEQYRINTLLDNGYEIELKWSNETDSYILTETKHIKKKIWQENKHWYEIKKYKKDLKKINQMFNDIKINLKIGPFEILS